LIESLRIEDLAIVERAELEFGPGLNVLTGETGAGKSIVLGALALLAGGRASADSVREGCDAASVEAVFRTEGLADLEADLAERELRVDDHELIVQRRVARSGRGRARVAGELVPVSVLAELFADRIEISSQHDTQALRRPDAHGVLLDRMGALLDVRAQVAEGHRSLRALDDELEQLRVEARERVRRLDFLRFQVREIEEAALDPGTIEENRHERSRLAHAGRICEEGGGALAALCGDPMDEAGGGAADRLAAAAKRVGALIDVDAGLADVAARLDALASEVRDAALDMERHLAGVEHDPARLASLDERLHQVETLQRKYGAGVEDVLRFRDEATRELAEIESADERESELERERAAVCSRLGEAAGALSAGRARAARKLGRAVQAELRDLAMPQARFAVALAPVTPPEGLPCGPSGAEAAEFRFSANAGEPLRPFRKVASGGELSRALLGIRGALRAEARGMVLVFDEADAGIGGRAADRVGRALAGLAAHHQVLCITHLPQIAAFANVHVRVEKREARGRTCAVLHRVEGEARIEELARMAGGERVGAATLRHARELLLERTPTASNS